MAQASIVLTGLAANDPVPGVYTEINFAQGPSTGAQGQRPILCLANASAAGAAIRDTQIYGPDTSTPLQSEADMIFYGGAGSEAHRLYRRIAAVNTVTPVYWVFVSSSAGAKATYAIVITGTATANGTLRTYVGDDFVDTAITSGDTPAIISANVATNVNSKSYWACTANGTATPGTVTLTAVCPGLRGNWLRAQATIFSTLPITTALTGNAEGPFTGGTTADSNALALSTIAPFRYYRIVSAAEDATQFGALASQVLTQAGATIGIRQRCFAGSVDTLANAQTIAVGINSARAELIWLQSSTWTPAELAANAAAVYAIFEDSGTKPRNNFSGFPTNPTDQGYWKVPAPRATSVAPSRASIKSALLNGVTPINPNPNGSTTLVKGITTRSLTGSVNDYRIRDRHKVTNSDFFADDLQTKVFLQFGGKDLSNDPPQGTPPIAGQVTPRLLKACIVKLISDYGDNGQLQNVPTIIAGTIVQRETSPTTRMSAAIPLQIVDIFDQAALQVNQVG